MKIIPYKKDNEKYAEPRYAIADDGGKIIDDAGGWGYKTEQKAHKAMWYKFNGGKQKIQTEEDERKAFFKKHKVLSQFIDNIFEDITKEWQEEK